MSRLKQLIHEVHRRSLWQVLGIYVLGSWIALQVVDVLANNVGLPTWFPPFALALLIIGLPIVLATAVVQEGVGTKAESDALGPSSPADEPSDVSTAPMASHHRLFTWKNAIIGGVAAALLWGGFAAGWFLFGRSGSAEAVAEVPIAEEAEEDRRSIAVLPLANRSALEEDAWDRRLPRFGP